MKLWKKALTGILALAVAFTVSGQNKAEASAPADPLDMSVPGDKVLTFEHQKPQDFVVNVTNNGTDTVRNIAVRPRLNSNSDKWPFKIAYQKYTETIPELEAGGTASVTFSFTQRDDVPTASYGIKFIYEADGGITGAKKFFVNTTAKPEEKPKEEPKEEPRDEPGSSGRDDADPASAGGGFSNGDAAYSGGGGGSEGGSSNGSVPRVIVTGFTTNPAEVRAGSDFTLTIHLKNTAKSTRVGNMLFDLSAPTEGSDEQTTAPAFLPASGSSSVYLEGIPANGAADITIQLNAKADLLQKPYSVELSMKYEDADAAQIEASSSISIPVRQDARFEFSEFEISPDMVAVGEESNVMCSLYNLGRIKLYNVKASFEGTSVKKTETFIGNVESGATASIDATLEATKESNGPGKITMTVSYEDEAGKISSLTKDLQIEVTQAMDEDMPSAEMDMMQEEGKKFPLVPVIAGVVILAAAAVFVVVRKSRKKKLMSNEEEELLNELDGSAEDER